MASDWLRFYWKIRQGVALPAIVTGKMVRERKGNEMYALRTDGAGGLRVIRRAVPCVP